MALFMLFPLPGNLCGLFYPGLYSLRHQLRCHLLGAPKLSWEPPPLPTLTNSESPRWGYKPLLVFWLHSRHYLYASPECFWSQATETMFETTWAKEGQGFIWVPGKLNAEMRAVGKSLVPTYTSIIPILLFIYVTALLKCNWHTNKLHKYKLQCGEFWHMDMPTEPSPGKIINIPINSKDFLCPFVISSSLPFLPTPLHPFFRQPLFCCLSLYNSL